jgi:hypothetical protein
MGLALLYGTWINIIIFSKFIKYSNNFVAVDNICVVRRRIVVQNIWGLLRLGNDSTPNSEGVVHQ